MQSEDDVDDDTGSESESEAEPAITLEIEERPVESVIPVAISPPYYPKPCIKENIGWIYCLSNPALKTNYYKIGMTKRDPEIRAKELCRPTGVPEPFIVEFAKLVDEPKKKERDIHSILEETYDRPNPKREYFIVPIQLVKSLFKLCSGIWWEGDYGVDEDGNPIYEEDENEEDDDEEEEEEEEEEEHSEEEEVKIGCRDARKCFIDGQRIRHKYGVTAEWIGTYKKKDNSIRHDGNIYKGPRGSPLNAFAGAHRISLGKRKNINGWTACQCEINGKWESCKNLPEL